MCEVFFNFGAVTMRARRRKKLWGVLTFFNRNLRPVFEHQSSTTSVTEVASVRLANRVTLRFDLCSRWVPSFLRLMVARFKPWTLQSWCDCATAVLSIVQFYKVHGKDLCKSIHATLLFVQEARPLCVHYFSKKSCIRRSFVGGCDSADTAVASNTRRRRSVSRERSCTL